MLDDSYAGWPDDISTHKSNPHWVAFRAKRLHMRVGVPVRSSLPLFYYGQPLQTNMRFEAPYMLPCGQRNLDAFERCRLPGFLFELIDFIARVIVEL